MEQITITANITARDIENAAAQLVTIYNDARQNGGRPSDTIRAAVAAIGYDLTAATVATWITGKTGDGRIARRNLDFAATVPGSLTLDEIRARWIYAPSDIHPAHLDQLADALREYVPEDPTPAAPETAASSDETPDQTETDTPNAENALTEAERRKTSERAAEWAASVRWGLTREQLLKFIADHKTARAEGDAITAYYIEECLTEINFHTACSAINRGDYDAALADFDGKFDPDPTPEDHDPANVIPFPAPAETEAPAPQESEPTPADVTAALIAEITAVAALIPGCKPEVKGAKTSKPVIWLHGVTKEHKDAAKALGAAWAAKKAAWWITPDRYTTRREIPAE